MTDGKRAALVTGAIRGLGLEVSRQLAERGVHVHMGIRDMQKGAAAVAGLADEGLDVELLVLDVSSPDTPSIVGSCSDLGQGFPHEA